MRPTPIALAAAVLFSGFALAQTLSSQPPPTIPQAVLEPERVVVHIARSQYPPPRGPDGGPGPLGIFASVQSREFAGSSPEAKALAALFAAGDLSNKARSPMKCIFNADLGVEWIRGGQRHHAVFCFSCGQVSSDASVRSFTSTALGKWAHGIFPKHEPFARVAEGKPPH